MAGHDQAPFGSFIRRTGLAAVGLALALLAISSAAAFAATGHSVVRTFSTGVNVEARSIAVDSAGNSYVFEKVGRRIEKFDAGGNRVDFTGSAKYIGDGRIVGTPKGLFPDQVNAEFFDIEVDSSGGSTDGDIYVVQELETDVGIRSSVLVYDSTGIFLGELDPGRTSKSRFCSAAVNQANGDVYFALGGGFTGQFPREVLRYSAPTGKPEAATPTGALLVWSCAISVDSSGAVRAVDRETGSIRKYDASQFGVPSPNPVQEFSPGGASALALGAGGDLFADRGYAITRWNSAGVRQGPDFGPLSGSSDLAIGPAGNVFATDFGGGIFVLAPNEVQLPTGTTGASSNLTPDSAKVEGSVDPDGAGDITACEFRYGEDTGYSEGSVSCTPGGAISSPTAVSANLTGLVSNTTYHYRLFLTNANGTQMETGDQTFATTAATQNVGTAAPSNVQNDSAELNGYFEGDGQAVHYFFEWGRTTAYGHTTPVPPGDDAGNTPGFQNVAPVQISGLSGSAPYHYRLVVSTATGITRGQDETFTTAEAVANLTADQPSAIKDTSVELNGSYDGDPSYETHHYFEWGTTIKYGNVTPVPPGTAIPATEERVKVPPVQIAGLKGGSLYHFRLVASNATGTSASPDRVFETAKAPSVSGINTRNVLASSAELIGDVNPNFGHATYRFEWGPTTFYGNVSPVPDGDVGSGSSAVAVSTKLEGLSPGVIYHFRLVASNEYGIATSADQTFGFYPPNCPNSQLRQETRSNRLPDCRAYELVSPSYGQGTTITPAGGIPAPFATSPSRLSYTGLWGTFPEEVGDPPNTGQDHYVSTRSDSGWFQRYVGRGVTQSPYEGGPPGPSLNTNFGIARPNRFFVGAQTSRDLSKVISYTWGYPSNSFGQLGKPSNAPYVWDAVSGNLLERWPNNLAAVKNGDRFVGTPKTSADLSHFVFPSNLVFAPGGNEVEREIFCCLLQGKLPELPASIYDNDLVTGNVQLASLKKDNKTGFEGVIFDVSDDGRRILMSEEKASAAGPLPWAEELNDVKGPFYVRVDGERTWEIAPGHQITYVGSTDDGATVYLTSAEQLTADDHDQGRDLFIWSESDPDSLTRVSKGEFGDAGNGEDCEATWSGGGCGVQMIDFYPYTGYPLGDSGFHANQGGNGLNDSMIASRSGDVYFLSPEQLIEGKGQQSRANLYLERKGKLRFVASLNPQQVCSAFFDLPTHIPTVCADGPIARMQVTPDGDHMAFVASSNLTGYDSAGHTEMYTYDPERGEVTCASCRLDGQPPAHEVWASQNGLFQTYDGRVFFSTEDPLVPRDTNGFTDVYEYTEGRAQLVTTGAGPYFRATTDIATDGLVGVSANGTDVYFSTAETLVTQDHNGASTLKIYDARTGGGFSAERTPEKCAAADECHGPGVPDPALPADRTSAPLGKRAKPKAHKPKKHRKAHKHKKKRGKAKKKSKSNGKQGRA